MLFQSAASCSLTRGARLRYPLQDSKGVLLLAQGAEINNRLHAILQTRGISLSMMACLKVTAGGPLDLEIPLRKDQLIIGRRPDCDVQLPSSVVSGHHCRIEKRLAGVFLQDLGSSNGTYLNGRPIKKEAELSDQDSLRVADTVFAIEIYAALAADSEQGAEAIQLWIFEESASNRRSASPYCPTEPDFELPAIP